MKTFKFIALFQLFLLLTYLGNVYQLSQCDFDSKGNWKGEIIHGIGVFGVPSFIVTAFVNFEK